MNFDAEQMVYVDPTLEQHDMDEIIDMLEVMAEEEQLNELLVQDLGLVTEMVTN